MNNQDQSFEQLLRETPLAAAADTVTVIGALARAPEADKFVLILADGYNVALEIKAVKSFTRLGGAVGQVLVRLELDKKLLPRELDRRGWFENKAAWLDIGKLPILDLKPPAQDQAFTIIEVSGPGDPGGPYTAVEAPFGSAAGGIAPFSLATAHQAPIAPLARAYKITADSTVHKIFADNTGPGDYKWIPDDR